MNRRACLRGGSMAIGDEAKKRRALDYALRTATRLILDLRPDLTARDLSDMTLLQLLEFGREVQEPRPASEFASLFPDRESEDFSVGGWPCWTR